MTLFEALTGEAFDRLNWQHSGEFDQNFSKKSNALGFAREGMGGFGIDRYITSIVVVSSVVEMGSCGTWGSNSMIQSLLMTSPLC